MTKNTTRVALAAVAATVLAGCLDSNPIEPSYACTLDATPDFDITGDTITTNSGLKYFRLAAGDSAATRVQSNSSVDVCYVGAFLNESVFDLGSLNFTPSEGKLIPGFTEGVVGMRGGESRRIIVPPALGYGSTDVKDRNGVVVIPANSTLVFDVGVQRIR